jgi:hypothetical protein
VQPLVRRPIAAARFYRRSHKEDSLRFLQLLGDALWKRERERERERAFGNHV